VYLKEYINNARSHERQNYTSSLFLAQLLYQETNPGVQYEYSIPKGVSPSTDADSYSWIAEDFSECSATCGGGIRYVYIVESHCS
jgi:hypothetical protein